jgi:hypothetical protein
LKDEQELVNSTKNIFSLNLIVVLYIILTILSITDTQLVLNGIVKLPIFNVEIILTTFFILAPITLLILFIYFFIHLNSSILEVNKLGTNSNTWLILESFLHHETIKTNPSKLFNGLEKLVGNFLVWWLLPITNLIIMYKIVYTHQNDLICLIGVVTFVTNLLLLMFYNDLHNRTLKWKIGLYLSLIAFIIIYFLSSQSLSKILVNTQIRLEHLYIGLLIVSVVMVIIYFSSKLKRTSSIILGLLWIIIFLSPITFWHHYTIIADVGEKKNISLNGQALNDNIASKIDLRGKKLDGADLVGATLLNALLRNTDLREASLSDATLDGSDFENALLDSAILQGTSLLKVKNLSYEQLKNVKTLYHARFDSSMDSIISKLNSDFPKLFKEPHK